MKVLFDSTIFDLQLFGGVSRYFAELIAISARKKLFEPKFQLFISNNEYAKKLKLTRIKSNLSTINIKGAKRFSWKLNSFLNSFYTNRHLRKGDFDIYHPTYYSKKSLAFTKKYKTVITVYDMIHELYPALFSEAQTTIQLKAELMRSAAKIIAISENTKKDILTFYPEIDEQKISVILLSSSMNEYKEAPVSVPFKKFILFVGSREGYKNFIPMLKTITPFLKTNKDIGLICCGGGKFTNSESEIISAEQFDERIIQQNVSDEELKWLYLNSIALLFPSEYEGFGIPVIETFDCGCPVILPNLSSFTEIGGDAGLFYEKGEMEKINYYLENLLSSPQFRDEVISKSKKQASNFSWEKMATQTAELYRSI